MESSTDPGGTAAGDLTGRARIRDAALRVFAERGFKGATVQLIADAAGVSTGLIRHHFGSKEGLREVCDAFAIGALLDQADRSLGDEAAEPGFMTGMLNESEASSRYLARALIEGSPAASALFDKGTRAAEGFLSQRWPDRFPPGSAAVRDAAAVMGAMHLGPLVLHAHLSRLMGADVLARAHAARTPAAMVAVYGAMAEFFGGTEGARIGDAVTRESEASAPDAEGRDER
ncbi:TetR/AcrR family transcriptional regulator [Allonocardiopsis opalescens]|uniref:TetR family transcriptional regulator n=1 Tax=Allonocardiopsis opalescens TaxID=1144618 RepID=A0A2T0PPM3_9ACTN|nr:TetR/AcrR family transcriptional regulator [Allonocardiopsis opalescens]PRX90758.1 TetR family transcriptional regulator [Allonocardiopsis opalescens]